MAYVTAEELQTELEGLANDLGITIQELLARYTTTEDLNTELSTIKLDIQKITEVGELDGESIAEKIIAINEQIGQASDDVVKSLFDRISTNEAVIAAETTRSEGIEAGLRVDVDAANTKGNNNAGNITALETTVGNNKTDIEGTFGALDTRVQGLEATDKAMFSYTEDGVDVEGTVNKEVRLEKERTVAALAAQKTALTTDIATAKDEAATAANSYTDTEVAKVQSSNDSNSDAIELLNNDTTVTGSVAQKVKAAKDDLTSTFTEAMGDALGTLNNTDIGLQNQIDAITGSGTGSIGDLEGRTGLIEGRLNDVVDEATGDITSKGITSKLADAEAAIVANKSSQTTINTTVQTTLDGLAGSGLETGIISGRKAANKFRDIFGLANLV